MPNPSHHNAVVGYNGKLYLFGGGVQRQPGGPTQFPTESAREYDPVADTWRDLAPMPLRRLGAVAVESGGKIFVMGGAGPYPGMENQPIGAEPHRVLDTNHMYDPATNTWTVRQTMPTPRNHMFAGAVNGNIISSAYAWIDAGVPEHHGLARVRHRGRPLVRVSC